MRYAEKVMLHNLIQQTMADKNVYNELSYSADSRLWFVGKQGIQDIMTDLIERYAFEYDLIHSLAVRERDELRTKNNDEYAMRLYNIQVDLLEEVVEIKSRMIKTLKSIWYSISMMKSFSKADITDLIGLADQFVPKLRDLSDVAALLVKSDLPFYKNFYKSK